MQALPLNDRLIFDSRARMYRRVYAPLVAAELKSEIVHAAMEAWRSLFLDAEGEAVWRLVDDDFSYE